RKVDLQFVGAYMDPEPLQPLLDNALAVGQAADATLEEVNAYALNYDTANVLFYGGVDLKADLTACMPQVGYMHLKEKAGERTEWNFPALGEGWIDFPMVFDLLKQANNECPFSLEIEFTQAGPKSLEQVNEALRTSAKYLVDHGFAL
ncbi:MAG: TIM barrel protein, partial [Clostridia bacterium]